MEGGWREREWGIMSKISEYLLHIVLLLIKDESCVTVQLSREGLVHPLKDMFDLTQYLYSYYGMASTKSCTNKLLRDITLFLVRFSDSTVFELFFEGFCKKEICRNKCR